MYGQPGARQGFSLLEAVVALTVVGFVAIAILGAVGVELRTAGRIRQGVEAQALADAKLAELRLLTRDELKPLRDSLRRGQFPVPFDAYRWETSSRSVPEREDLFEVEVGIRWSEGAYSLTTRLHRPRRAG